MSKRRSGWKKKDKYGGEKDGEVEERKQKVEKRKVWYDKTTAVFLMMSRGLHIKQLVLTVVCVF